MADAREGSDRTLAFLRRLCAAPSRFHLLRAALTAGNVPHCVVEIQGARNIVCVLPGRIGAGAGSNLSSEPSRRAALPALTFAAHYDSAPGSPGANDNAAAVALLVDLALRLRSARPERAVGIIFFDREETASLGEIKTMGSYLLASRLREKGIREGTFIVLDMCGIGDTVVVSRTVDEMIQARRASSDRLSHDGLGHLRRRVTAHLLEGGVRSLSLRTPVSDDLGLGIFGYTAGLLSLLPYEEALDYAASKAPPPAWQKRHTRDDLPKTIKLPALEFMAGVLDRLTALPLSAAHPLNITSRVRVAANA